MREFNGSNHNVESGTSIRSFLFWAIVAIIVLGWSYLLWDGWGTIRALKSDSTGKIAWAFWAFASGADSASRQAFIAQWSDAAQRQSYITGFEYAFWQSRFIFYGVPTLVLGLLGLLIKPRD